MAQSLVLDHKLALLDTGLLDELVNPLNPLRLGKKGSFIRKDETTCNYYVVDTRATFTVAPTWHHQRVNEMCKMAMQRGYQYLVMVNC